MQSKLLYIYNYLIFIKAVVFHEEKAANQKCNSPTVLFELTEANTIIELIIMQANA